jgi:hypothetical protein
MRERGKRGNLMVISPIKKKKRDIHKYKVRSKNTRKFL